MKNTSIYHEYPISEELKANEEIEEWSRDLKNGFGNLGAQILYSLYKYRVLNKENIEKCVNLKNPNEWKRGNVRRVLPMLRSGGFVACRGFKDSKAEDDNYNLVLYMLTDKGFYEVQKDKDNANPENMVKDMADNELLKLASLNQWHISLLYSYKKAVISSIYNNFALEGKDIVPSVVKVKNGDKRATIFAFEAPRTEEEVKSFLIRILKLESYLLTANQYRPSMIVAVTESSKSLAWLTWQINKYRETRRISTLLTMDYITNLDEPLRYLQICVADEDGIKRLNMNFM
jgi:acetolactate synthase regulatory subunit